ncbi:MAG: ATP-grasp domain-containing protein, partial [Nitrospinae bacterium]|nr:ATP-grasp domain-containing protein [Nitrospinota bacterium]
PLSAEGVAIRRAAMDSFAKIPDIEPFTIQGRAGEFGHALARCDGLLIVAPETGGILEAFTGRAQASGKINLGCSADAVKATGDKLEFSRLMKTAGIPHPQTVEAGAKFDSSMYFTGTWVFKPADGAGAEGVNIHRQPRKVEPLIGPHIAQEFIEGGPMSLSIVSGNDWVEVLSVNRQRFLNDGMIYDGGEIIGEEPSAALRELAARIKKAVPGLSGYWGVDFVMTEAGPVVIEVNPRLTTSFCGLAEALNPTPALFIMAAATGNPPPAVTTRRATFFTKTGETRAV